MNDILERMYGADHDEVAMFVEALNKASEGVLIESYWSEMNGKQLSFHTRGDGFIYSNCSETCFLPSRVKFVGIDWIVFEYRYRYVTQLHNTHWIDSSWVEFKQYSMIGELNGHYAFQVNVKTGEYKHKKIGGYGSLTWMTDCDHSLLAPCKMSDNIAIYAKKEFGEFKCSHQYDNSKEGDFWYSNFFKIKLW